MSLQLLHEVQHEARRLLRVHRSEAAGAPQVRVDYCADHRLVHVIEVPKISFDDEEYTMTGCEQAARLLAPSTVFNRCGKVVCSLSLHYPSAATAIVSTEHIAGGEGLYVVGRALRYEMPD